ncbi:putative RNA recognition motif domain, nucleotide-binding alpha-beta plait domain superfamily [Helianthus debilis subsp. tardiflorus]
MSDDTRRLSTDDWHDILTRKGNRDSRQGAGNNKVITKFFVANIPPKCSSLDLKEVFNSFRKYEGSYIARKFDRRGKRFAFVSFSDVLDMKKLEKSMADVWVGSYKLFVAAARFVDGNTIKRANDDKKGKAKMNTQGVKAGECSGSAMHGEDVCNKTTDVGGGRSFLDSVLNRNKVDVIKVDDVVEGFSQWNGVALVGKVLDFNILSSLKKLLRNKGWVNVGIKYVGGFSVMLVFNDVEEVLKFYDDKSMWSMWFIDLCRWDDNNNGVEDRIAWLQIHGVPVQLALNEVFHVVGSTFGTVVRLPNMAVEDNNFSYAYVGVLCKYRSRIKDKVDINWRGRIFNVWIDEDVGDWVPDCVEDCNDDSVLEKMDERVEVSNDVILDLDDYRQEDEVEAGEIREELREDSIPIEVQAAGLCKENYGEFPVNGSSGVRKVVSESQGWK